MNTPYELVPVPTERALRDVDAGINDADIARSGVVTSLYSNLIRTQKEITTFHLVAYVKKDSSIKIHKPVDIAKYKIGFVNGTKIAEEYAKKYKISPQIVNDQDSLVAILEAGRIDAALIATIQNLTPLEKVGKQLPVPLYETKMFHIYNKKHAELAKKFDATFEKLKKTDPKFREGLKGITTTK